MAQKYKSRHKGSEIDNAVDKVKNLAAVATSGSYNDLTDKPDGGADITVDSALSTSSTNPVQNKVVTAELNKKGTYSKPSTGIPKSDLANDVQESLGKADTALQSFEERYKGTVTSVKINGSTKNPDADGLVDLGNIEGGEGGSVIVDEALSDTSTNPVQNKAITNALQSRLQSFWTPNPGYDANALQKNSFVSFTYANGAPVHGVLADFCTGYYGFQLTTNYFDDGPLYYRSHAPANDGGIGIWQQIARVNENKLTPSSGTLTIDGAIKANDYLDAYGISLYETFATKVGTMVYEDSYIADANSWATNGWVKTSAETINLPAQSSINWGTLCTIIENANNGSKVQIWIPVDGSHKGRIFTRAASVIGFSEWHLLATKTELEEALQGGGGNEVVSIKLTLNGSNTTTNINGAKVVVNNISKGTTATYSWAGNDITATVPAGDTFSVVCHACNSYAPPAEFSSVAIKGNNRIVSLNYITAPTGVYFCSNTGALTGSKDGNTVGIYVGSSSLKRVITPNKYLGYITGSTDSGSTNNSNGRVPTNNCTPYITFGDIDYDPWLPSVVKGVSLLGKKCYIPASDEYSMLGSNKDAVTSYIAQFGNVYDHKKQAHFSSGFLYYGSTGPTAYYDEPIYAYSFGMVEY